MIEVKFENSKLDLAQWNEAWLNNYQYLGIFINEYNKANPTAKALILFEEKEKSKGWICLYPKVICEDTTLKAFLWEQIEQLVGLPEFQIDKNDKTWLH